MIAQTGSDVRRMLRSIYWVGYAVPEGHGKRCLTRHYLCDWLPHTTTSRIVAYDGSTGGRMALTKTLVPVNKSLQMPTGHHQVAVVEVGVGAGPAEIVFVVGGKR